MIWALEVTKFIVECETVSNKGKQQSFVVMQSVISSSVITIINLQTNADCVQNSL